MEKMHEYSLASNILNTCIQSANQYNAKFIKEVHLELGDFALIVEHMLQECFNIASKGSMAEDAKLVMKRTPGTLKCNDCGKTSEIWFEEEKKREEENADNSLEAYEKGIAESSGVSGYKYLGVNLFQCRKCGSKNTELTGGKEIKIKNIKVTE